MALNNHVENFTLDMAPGGIAPVLNVSQGDTGRTFTADMYWAGTSYDVSGLTVRLRGRKRDNTVFDYALSAPSGSEVTFETQEQMTIIPGNVECELVFTDSNSRVVGTANFVFIVEESPYDPNAISESEVTGLVDLISDQIGGAVDDWMETEAPTSPEFAAAMQDATDAYLDENGVTVRYEKLANYSMFDEAEDKLTNAEDMEYTVEPGYIAVNGTLTPASSTNKEVTTSHISMSFPYKYVVMLSVPEGAQWWACAAYYTGNEVYDGRYYLDDSSHTPQTENGRKYFVTTLWNNPNITSFRITFRGFGDYSLHIKRFPAFNMEKLQLHPIMMGDAGEAKFINFDTTAKTMTIPGDSLLYVPYNKAQPQTQLSPYGTDLVINLDTSPSSAKLLFFNISTKEFVWKSYDDNAAFLDLSLCLIAIIRAVKNNSGTYTTIAPTINAPYKVNGKMYGVEFDGVEELPNRATIFDNNVNSINHRGYNRVAPENTIPAFKLSKVNGFDMVETDVHFTSDNVPVCIHDSTIDRTSDGTGAVSSMTYNQLLQYDFGSWKSSEYAGTKIPSFEEFILLCRNIQLNPYIEIKDGTQAQLAGLVDIVNKYGMSGKVTWISFSSSALTQIKNADKFARLGLVTGTDVTDFTANIATANGLKTGVNSVFIDAYYLTVTETTMATCEAANIPVEVWGADTEPSVLGLYHYVTGVTSDLIVASKALYDANIS